MMVRGNGVSVETLEEAGAGDADLLVAATNSDENNLLCCHCAHLLGAGCTVARVRSVDYAGDLDYLKADLGIDLLVNPELATAREISRLLRFPFAINTESFAHGRVEMVEFRADSHDSVVGVPLAKLHGHYPSIQFTAVQRGGEAIIPDGRFEIQAGDRVYATGDRDSITRFFKQMGKDTQRMKSALLIGGGQLAHRFFRDVIEGRGSTAMQYVGYLDAAPREGLPAYLGTVDSLYELLQTHKVDMIVLAQDVQDVATTQRIMMLADNFHLRGAAVPVDNGYVSSRTEISTLGGMRFVDLRLLNTCEIMGVNIVVTDMEKTVRLLEEKLEDWRGKYICVANVHTTVTAHDDPTYQAVQNGAVMALPDGGPLSQFSREQGYVDAARVTGPDLMKEMLKESADKHYRHYFYGSTQETLDILKATIEKNYPGAVIAGMYSPPFRPLTPEEDAAVIRRINETKPDFVWVGLGAPKQERWMAAHEDKVQAVMVGVGAAFDYEAGNIRRAPMWMQRHNLEWLYRLMQDPKRLFKRYLTTNIKYLWWTWKQ